MVEEREKKAAEATKVETKTIEPPKPKDASKSQYKGEKPQGNVKVETGNYCSCVSHVRAITGTNTGIIGVARNHPINSQTPEVGAIVVLAEGSIGHVAVVTSVNEESITLDEANYAHCQRTTGRTLKRTSSRIRGFYTK